jgi:DNA polymerase-1
VLVDMERAGIRVDPVILREIGTQLEAELRELEQQIHAHAGQAFNINSTQQLGDILFNRLGLKATRKTATGKASTSEEVLQELTTEHPLPGLILDWRELVKLKSTYVDSLADLIHPVTGRVHTSFNQTIAATGRLSSTNPNLQNIPIRTARGRELRKAFVPKEGWKLISADYAQIELRILAALSGDVALKQAFAERQDVHTATAARVFGVSPEQVTRDQRRKAKEVNYGIPYGVSPFGLAQRLRVPMKEAQALIEQYQRSFPEVTRYLALQVERAREQGYVETLLGRRRYVPDIHARNRNVRSFAERVAVNMPMQGTQADMIKLAMVRLHRRLQDAGLQGRMLLQVHDELVLEAPPQECEALRTVLAEEMTQALPLDGVPVEVDIGVGDNWLDAK